MSMISRRPVVKPPIAPPSALPSVLVTMSTRPITPACSALPRPVLPTKPVACESSTSTVARWRSARSQIDLRSATVPSMLNTPSVAIRTWRQPFARASPRQRSRSAMSLLA